MITPTIGILTPTIGKPELLDCLRSVAAQTIPVRHYVVIDGEDYADAATARMDECLSTSHLRVITLQENVGKGFYGHRVYASVPALMNTDLVIYLDEDNTITPDHCESLLDTLNHTQAQWAYSLRNIVSATGEWLCRDNCESLGKWDAYVPVPNFNQSYRHIDTSCYCVPRTLAITVGPAWYGGWGADRVFFEHLRQVAPSFACSGLYTVNYRLGGNAGSVQLPYFLAGNAAYAQRFHATFPWLHQEVSHHASQSVARTHAPQTKIS